jgi:hypothetical protein
VYKREKEAGMPEGKVEDKIKIPRIKNAETEHAGIKCAGTERNWTENADSERDYAPRGTNIAILLGSRKQDWASKGRAGPGTKSSEVALCRDGPCKDRQDPECEQRQREGCVLCMFALETLFQECTFIFKVRLCDLCQE